MDLGIRRLVEQYQELASGSIYFLTCQSKRAAINVALNCLCHNSFGKDSFRYLVLDDVNQSEINETTLPKELVEKIRAHVLVSSHQSKILATLVDDIIYLDAAVKGALYLVILRDDYILRYSTQELELIFNSIADFAKRHEVELLFVSYGVNQDSLTKVLLKHGHTLNGLCSFQEKPNGIDLNTLFWKDSTGAITQGIHPINLTSKGYELVIANQNDLLSADQNTCYLVKDSFTPNSTVFSTVFTYDLNSQVYQLSMESANSATVCFTLNRRDEIDALAEYIYKLRTTRGKNLKIMVIEKIPGIRAQSEQFLVSCGANFIFESGAKSSYINAVMPTLKTLQYQKIITASFKSLLESYHLIDSEGKGFLAPINFVDKVRFFLSKNLNSGNLEGALVILTCHKHLNPQMCMTQFKPKRGGDYCTMVQDKIVVFLPSCREGEVTVSLEHTFNTNPVKLFSSCHALFTYQEILDTVNSLLNLGTNSAIYGNLMIEMMEKNQLEEQMRRKAHDIYDLVDEKEFAATPTTFAQIKEIKNA